MAHLGDPRIPLAAGEFAPLPRFRPLRHFDLKLFGLGQVIAGHTKAPRSHLLDGAVLGIAVWLGNISRRIFAALAGVALAADSIHGDGQCLVRFFADRSIRHGAGLKAFDDRIHWLHLFDGYGMGGVFKPHESPQRSYSLRLIVDEPSVFFE